MPLTERDRAMLDFERAWWSEDGSKESRIRRRFGVSPARYYQVLGQLVDDEEAARYDPLVIRRLRRRRQQLRRERFEGRSAGERPSR